MTLALLSGQEIVSIVTSDSVKSLNLMEGTDAIAFIKASSVLVMTENPGVRFSARNSLSGTVTALSKGPIHAEITITLPAGEEVHATITHKASDALGLAEGVAATALIKAPLVILGVPT